MLRRDLKGRECTERLPASGGKPGGGSLAGDAGGRLGREERVVFLPSEAPAANVTGTCHSVPVCCALFHSDALAGIEKSRTCKEATAGSCLQAGGSKHTTHRAVTGLLSARQWQL